MSAQFVPHDPGGLLKHGGGGDDPVTTDRPALLGIGDLLHATESSEAP